MKYDLSALDNKPIRPSAYFCAVLVMAIGTYACMQPDKTMTYTVIGAFLICVPSLFALLRAWRRAHQLNLLAACERIVDEKEMQVQMARVQRDFGSFDELRSGAVFKNF